MNNTRPIRPAEEEIKMLRYKFLTDRRIATLNNEIAAIYNVSIPKYLIVEDGIPTIKYEERVEYEVNRVRSIITKIIEAEYTDLLIHLIHWETT